jgi:hypothetical protein
LRHGGLCVRQVVHI